jgi:hypothetical protein
LSTLDQLQSSDFAPYLHQGFRIRMNETELIDLELVGVSELGAAGREGGRRPFALHFLGPISDQYLTQGTFALEHEQLGMLQIFIVPLGLENQRMRYEAIFN